MQNLRSKLKRGGVLYLRSLITSLRQDPVITSWWQDPFGWIRNSAQRDLDQVLTTEEKSIRSRSVPFRESLSHQIDVCTCNPDIKSFLYEAIAASPPLLVCDRSFGTWGWNRSLEIEAGQLWIFCSYPGKYTRFIARFIKINNYLLFNAESLIEHLHGLQPGSKVHNFAGASQ